MSHLDEATAFPFAFTFPNSGPEAHYGFSKREHAAIALRVPQSGDTELDAMIREARRLNMTEKFLASSLQIHETYVALKEESFTPVELAESAVEWANILALARLNTPESTEAPLAREG